MTTDGGPVLVVGATGLLGGRIVSKLLGRGVRVRALVREGTDASALGGVEVVRGDLQAATTLPPAVEGARAVVTTATAIGRRLAGDKHLSIERTDADGNLSLIEAAERAGVPRFVLVSVPDTPESLRAPLVRAKRAAEGRLERSSMRAVVLQPDMFQEVWLSELVQFDWRSGRVVVFGRGDTRHAYVAVDDVAEAAVRVTLADDPPAVMAFGGPEALTRNEVVQRFEAATGRPLKVRRVPRFVLRAGAAALGRFNSAQASVMAMAYAADVGGEPPSAEPLRALGIEPRPAGRYIEEVARSG